MRCLSLKVYGVLIGAMTLTLITGCVERTLKIDSTPRGARVFVNDEEVGVTPLKTSFIWYGDYDIILRREGYHTLKTNYLAKAPWYQYPPFDLISECLVVSTIKDEHVLPTYELIPAVPADLKEVVQRAADLRAEAVGRASPD